MRKRFGFLLSLVILQQWVSVYTRGVLDVAVLSSSSFAIVAQQPKKSKEYADVSEVRYASASRASCSRLSMDHAGHFAEFRPLEKLSTTASLFISWRCCG